MTSRTTVGHVTIAKDPMGQFLQCIFGGRHNV